MTFLPAGPEVVLARPSAQGGLPHEAGCLSCPFSGELSVPLAVTRLPSSLTGDGHGELVQLWGDGTHQKDPWTMSRPPWAVLLEKTWGGWPRPRVLVSRVCGQPATSPAGVQTLASCSHKLLVFGEGSCEQADVVCSTEGHPGWGLAQGSSGSRGQTLWRHGGRAARGARTNRVGQRGL